MNADEPKNNGAHDIEILKLRNDFTNKRQKEYSQALVDLMKACNGGETGLKGTSRNKRRQFERWMDKHEVRTFQEKGLEDKLKNSSTLYIYSLDLGYISILEMAYDEEEMTFSVARKTIPKSDVDYEIRLRMLEDAEK